MATATGESIFARARVIGSQVSMDANQSPIIDSKGALRSLLNNVIREVYRRKMADQKFTQDINVRHTVVIGSGEGTVPDELMREMLISANITDDNSSLVSYFNYAQDATNSIFDQLGYLWIVGDTFNYTAPAPDLENYSGNLFVTCPTFPTFPASMSDPITFVSDATIDDIVLTLASAVRGNEQFQIIGAV